MLHSPKIKSIDELRELTESLRSASKTVVHCHGVFDLLHIGHIRYLQKAKELADVLIVTVTPDEFVNKGPHRPAFHEQPRMDAIASLECVDHVALNEWPTAAEAIERIRPQIYAKGVEFRSEKTPEIEREEQVAAQVGTRVEFIETAANSSTSLINEYLSPFSEETSQYLQACRLRRSEADFFEVLERAGELKVLVVGEAIIDEYVRCQTIGRASKAPIVETVFESDERHAGGALAVANHLAGLCRQVGLVTMLGDFNTAEEWVRGQLRENVAPTMLYKSNSPTIVKRRYLESYFGTPMFSINYINDDPPTDKESQALCETLHQTVSDYDLVVAIDYGHGMTSADAIGLLCNEARFLAVNAQANACNTGFHTISKYPRADYASLAEFELELECRARAHDPAPMLQQVAETLHAGTVTVTLGSRGSLSYRESEGFCSTPSLATKVVDRIGAGDTFLAVTSLCAALQTPLDVLGFLGNVAGAEAVAALGNSRYLEANSFHRHIESLLK